MGGLLRGTVAENKVRNKGCETKKRCKRVTSWGPYLTLKADVIKINHSSVGNCGPTKTLKTGVTPTVPPWELSKTLVVLGEPKFIKGSKKIKKKKAVRSGQISSRDIGGRHVVSLE